MARGYPDIRALSRAVGARVEDVEASEEKNPAFAGLARTVALS
jgi:hypothetical protein